MAWVLDFLFPKRCVSCGRFGRYICQNCLLRQKIHFPQVCPKCERASVDGRIHPGCKSRYSLDGLTAIFVYDGVVREAIKRLKYNFAKDLAFQLIKVTISRLRKEHLPPDLGQFVLVPIPLHPVRERWRGFNQAALLGRMISQELGLGFKDKILIRIEHTRPQMELKGEERRKNIKGAFSASPDIRVPRDYNILLFDDVWTTGATLRETGKVLKRAGAKFVWGLTIAR